MSTAKWLKKFGRPLSRGNNMLRRAFSLAIEDVNEVRDPQTECATPTTLLPHANLATFSASHTFV
jgi:hypothetical protein